LVQPKILLIDDPISSHDILKAIAEKTIKFAEEQKEFDPEFQNYLNEFCSISGKKESSKNRF
jgi:hypothetical protein